MAAVQDFKDIASFLISQFGLPVGAIALAGGLVRGARSLETDANPRALHYVSELLTEGNLKNIGKAGAGLVPFVFDKVFGPKPFTFRFISRSLIATSLFWLALLLAGHAEWQTQMNYIQKIGTPWIYFITLWYILDWVSLLKARFLITMISENRPLITSFLFLLIDITLSYISACIFNIVIAASLAVFSTYIVFSPDFTFTSMIESIIGNYMSTRMIINYFVTPSTDMTFADVAIPSTLLTSMWTFLLFVSSFVAQLLVPLDYLRRFTAFWFRDVEHKPLTAIAKVAATLIVIGALVVKAVRWI